MKLLKDELAVLILGQNMTTSDGSSRSQAEVHQIEQMEKYSSDEQNVLDVLNYEFIDKLPLWGYNVKPTMQFRFLETSAKAINQKLKNLTALQQLGLQLTDEEIREKFKDII